jgi:hypothetical protein
MNLVEGLSEYSAPTDAEKREIGEIFIRQQASLKEVQKRYHKIKPSSIKW